MEADDSPYGSLCQSTMNTHSGQLSYTLICLYIRILQKIYNVFLGIESFYYRLYEQSEHISQEMLFRKSIKSLENLLKVLYGDKDGTGVPM